MSVLDIILVALIGFGLVRGFFKGFFVEVASVVALVAGVYGAIHFSFYVAEFLETRTEWNEKTINVTAFAITFLIIILVVSLAGKALTKLASFAMLGIVNKLLGGVFGGLKMALIASILLIVFSKMNSAIPLLSEEELEESVLYEPIKNLTPLIFPNIIKSEDKETEEELEEPNNTLETESV
jgi:membrane protein required for colicin V production|tara:strand:+ start:748 stop:1293 length:546 start_codon:yes stop_codon:yes gene_type:complete